MSLSSRQKRWYWLLIIPYLAALWVPSYNRIEPDLFGMPFYYWYQLLWVVLSSVIVGVVFHCAHTRQTVDEKSASDNASPR